MNPHAVTEQFEQALAEYTGAPYAVATTSCTMALLLALSYEYAMGRRPPRGEVLCPTHTYVGVPQSILHAGFGVSFVAPPPDGHDWQRVGYYFLGGTQVTDSARMLTKGMCARRSTELLCLSFHWTKHLAIGQGGAIITHNGHAAGWLRQARFDGRRSGVDPESYEPAMLGYHAYMSPRDAADGLSRLAVLPEHNDPLPYCDYPDLSKMEIFNGR